MSLTLLNKERRMQVFNLPHEIYCEATGRCGCRERTVTIVEENPMTGERLPRSHVRKLPGALTLLAREKRENLPEAVLNVPEVKRAVDGGSLRVLTPVVQPARKVPAAATEPRARKDRERDKGK